MRDEFRTLALSLKWAGSQSEINIMLSAVGAASSAPKLKEAKSDRILMNAIGVADELDRVTNVFMERLREWYGLYFPEAERAVNDHRKFAEIAAVGKREDIDDEVVSKLAKRSAGMDFSGEDLEQVKELSKSVINLYDLRESLRNYIATSAKKTMPNISVVAGPELALRLVVLAGGLDKLAKMPSSTVQMLGAEKALFRHLKGKGSSPKHGIIFSHDLVQKAPHELRGKVARMVAAKLSLAARVDYFSKDDRGEKMRKELETQVRGAGGIQSPLVL
jgi:nucleolar protein 56